MTLPVEWTPADALLHDASDEQIFARIDYRFQHDASWRGAGVLVARELAAAVKAEVELTSADLPEEIISILNRCGLEIAEWATDYNHAPWCRSDYGKLAECDCGTAKTKTHWFALANEAFRAAGLEEITP